MENLSEKVYECTLAVEAHMVCDLLSQAGISARVDGEFMQSAMGEIPLGNAVKVRVDPARAAEAREVIAEWEKLQPAEQGAPVSRRSRAASPLWFCLGFLAGGIAIFVLLRGPQSNTVVDFNGDGFNEITYHYAGSYPSMTEFDRNGDRKVDARYQFDLQGYTKSYEADDDFDGQFEWQAKLEREQFKRSVLDSDGDGRPEQVWNFEKGVLTTVEYYFASGGRIVKREFYAAGLLDAAEFDDDGDGLFERRVQYDAHAEPKL